ncbi:ATP-binding cassette domain-containing protein [Streptomyces sp. HPF1205]|uniref:ATP-binding cassette domain-containing protein n=1 Tax=Streptomyces sp. HPF1205 TaxID=2873262 RepID=UPI0027DEBDF8|nr:ATP-binding cassette domain-containing protein [Streptomyces sp. HPF1205]
MSTPGGAMSTPGAFLALRPRVRPDLVVTPRLMRGPTPVHLIRHPATGARMEVGAKEHFLITRLDGTRSLADLGTQYAAAFGSRLGEAQWQQLLRLLSVRGLLAGGPEPAAMEPAGDRRPGAKGGGWLSGRTRMVADAPALMDRLHAATAFARHKAVAAALAALCAALLAAEGVRFGELADDTRRLWHEPVTLCAAGVVLWVSLGLHELAHGLVARTYGLRVGEIGLRRWAGVMTYLYCEVEDVPFLGRRRRQVAIALAGAAANLVFLLPFWGVRALLPDSAQAAPFFGGLILPGTAMALFNLVPLPPLDGYKALGYALGTLRLASESRTYTKVVLAAAVLRRPGAGRRAAAYPVRVRWVYGGYAVLCALLAAAALAGAGLAARAALPGGWRAFSAFLPVALVAVAAVLRLLGLRFAAKRPQPPPRPVADGPARDGAPPPEDGPARTPEPPSEETRSMTTPHRPSRPAVVLDGVSKRYGEVRALEGVSFSVGEGEFFGILGPNGAGKTTLVEIVEGMRRADAGTVAVLGRSPWPRDLALLRRVGVQTQASAFFTRLTAGEHLETVAALHGLGRAAAGRALEEVGLGDKASSRVDDLSGGQRQRLALATALVHEPELIFLDEPTAALDPEARRSLWAVLKRLRTQGRTIVCTTHYLDEAEALCDRVAIIAGGRLAALDTPAALVRSLAAPARLLLPAGRMTPEQARAVEDVDRVLTEDGDMVIETRAANRVLVALAAYVDVAEIRTRTATLEDAYLRLIARAEAGTDEGTEPGTEPEAAAKAPGAGPAASAAAPTGPAAAEATGPAAGMTSATATGTEHSSR